MFRLIFISPAGIIVMSTRVCVCVCVFSVRKTYSPNHRRNLYNFLCMLPMTVA